MDFGTMLEGFRFGAPGSPSPLKRAKTAPKPEVGSKIDNEIEESWHISDSEGDVGEGNDDVAGTATSQEATGATSPIDTRNHETQKSVTLEENNKTGAVAGDVRDDENRTATDDAALTYGDCVDADESLMRVTPPATTSSGKRNNFFLPKGHPGRPNEPAPAGWREVLDTITDHRATQPPAPVDAFHAFLLSLRTAPDAHFQALVASLLSVQCLDSVALRATKLLRERLGGEITVSAVHSAPLADVLDAISTCNFKNSKAKYVKQCASMVKIKFNGKVPQSISDLQSLPGVGPKLARLLNSVAFGNDDTGIVVDTHVRRVAGRLGWTCLDHKTSAEKTRRRLEEFLPETEWGIVPLALIGFAQVTCVSRFPKCHECPVNGKCPSSTRENPYEQIVRSSGRTEIQDVEDLAPAG